LLVTGNADDEEYAGDCFQGSRFGGSVVAFTAYFLLLEYFPATTLGSYAHVNPVVALALGCWFGKESIDWVVLILRGNRGVH
jgi:drug/metabolite transporter (DMT)-like permease